MLIFYRCNATRADPGLSQTRCTLDRWRRQQQATAAALFSFTSNQASWMRIDAHPMQQCKCSAAVGHCHMDHLILSIELEFFFDRIICIHKDIPLTLYNVHLLYHSYSDDLIYEVIQDQYQSESFSVLMF